MDPTRHERTKKVREEIMAQRRQKRNNLINRKREHSADHSMSSQNISYSKSTSAPPVMRKAVSVSSFMTMKSYRSNLDTSSSLDSTYLVQNNTSRCMDDTFSFTQKRNLLETWKQERQKTMSKFSIKDRPIFKVCHLDPREYELQKMQPILPNSSTFNFNLPSNLSHIKPASLPPRPQTRARVKKEESFSLAVSIEKTLKIQDKDMKVEETIKASLESVIHVEKAPVVIEEVKKEITISTPQVPQPPVEIQVEEVKSESPVDIKVNVTETRSRKSKRVSARLAKRFDMNLEIDKRDVEFYRNLVQYQTDSLNSAADKWLNMCQIDNPAEDIQGDIRTACGLAHLLIKERFSQFVELIDQCELCRTDTSIKEVKCLDLQGFWEMVEFQVADVQKRFEYLHILKDNDYNKDSQQVIDYELKRSTLEKAEQAQAAPITRPKKTIKKKIEEINSEDKESAPVKSKPARSKFSQFKAALIAKKQNVQDQVIEEERHETVTETVTEPFVSINEIPPIQPLLFNNPVRLSEIIMKPIPRRKTKSIIFDPLMEKDAQLDCEDVVISQSPAVEPAEENKSPKYNLRSRPSDLIKFESPIKSNQPTSFCSMISEVDENTLLSDNQSILSSTLLGGPGNDAKKTKLRKKLAKNKENTKKPDDFLAFMYEPPSIVIKSETDKINSPIGTPRRDISNSGSHLSASNSRPRESLSSVNGNHPGQVTNSPLLKMVFISSHGKRLSLSNSKN